MEYCARFRRFAERRDARMRPRYRSEGTRLNSSHLGISYAVFCLKKKSSRPASTGPEQIQQKLQQILEVTVFRLLKHTENVVYRQYIRCAMAVRDKTTTKDLGRERC